MGTKKKPTHFLDYILSRLVLEVRQDVSIGLRLFFVLASLLIGLLISLMFITNSGVSVSSIYEEFVVFTFFNSSGLATVFVETTPLVIVGLSAAVAFRINFWNIGIEGQFFMGVVGATLVAILDVGPENFRLLIMFLSAIIFGSLWILVPIFLKIKLAINEVVTTLLFNYIAYYFVLHQVYGSWKDPVDKFPHSEQYDLAERIPRLGWEEVNGGLIIAVLAILIFWWLIERSSFGLKSKFCGANPAMAMAMGLPFYFIMIVSGLSSGALSGVAGFVVASAHEFRLTPSIALGYGFSGIVIAFLAGNRPVAVVLVAFLMGTLYVAGDSLKVFYNLPSALVGLIQAIIVLSVASSEFFVRYRIRFLISKDK